MWKNFGGTQRYFKMNGATAFINSRNSLNINRLISLAESSAIQAPIIIGHLKPMILIPIGMCTSLSTEQLETIFLHEITHIRRKDYLINLLQLSGRGNLFFQSICLDCFRNNEAGTGTLL